MPPKAAGLGAIDSPTQTPWKPVEEGGAERVRSILRNDQRAMLRTSLPFAVGGPGGALVLRRLADRDHCVGNPLGALHWRTGLAAGWRSKECITKALLLGTV
ncbi:hypothetical protein MRX96_001151 [Rhipicephalus microplus]